MKRLTRALQEIRTTVMVEEKHIIAKIPDRVKTVLRRTDRGRLR